MRATKCFGTMAPYRAILRYYRCDTPYCAILFRGGLHYPQDGAIPPPWYLVSHRHIFAIPLFATYRAIIVRYPTKTSRAAKRGCFKRGGFPIWTCPSFFVLFCPFWDFPDFSGIFPICSGMVRGFSRFVLFLFLSLLRAPTRNSPERVRDTIWTFPEKSGKHPGLETPRFSFSQKQARKSFAILSLQVSSDMKSIAVGPLSWELFKSSFSIV